MRYLVKDIMREVRALHRDCASIEVGLRASCKSTRGSDDPDVRIWDDDVDLGDLMQIGTALREYRPVPGEVWDLYLYRRDDNDPLIGNMDLIFWSDTITVRDPFESSKYIPTSGTEHVL